MEHMHPLEVKSHMQKLGLMLPILRSIPTKALIEECSWSSAFGPFIDPTAWMNTIDSVSQNERILRALRAFQAVLDKELGPIPDADA